MYFKFSKLKFGFPTNFKDLFIYFGILFRLNNLNFFHNFNCFLLVLVIFFVLNCYLFIFFVLNNQKLNLNYKNVEFFCCLIPIIILIFQIIPSLIILWKNNYSFLNREITLKIIGHQWYWTYELGDLLDFSFDSYLKRVDSFLLGDFSLLEVDNRLILPLGIPVRFILTSRDVIHSWALPSFFLKLDCIPGVLTVFNFLFNSLGIFYGQCSEICGANHSFIPIVVEVVPFNLFKV